jgi:hypothetical protein
MIVHPELVIMIHDSMRQEENMKASLPRTNDQLGPISSVRAVTGNALIAIGTRIAPAPRRRTLTGPLPKAPVTVKAGT